MRTKIFNALKISAVAVVLTVGLSYAYAAVWVGPTATPPGNNAATPINVGSTAQSKAGAISTSVTVGNGFSGVSTAVNSSGVYGRSDDATSGFSLNPISSGVTGVGPTGVTGSGNAWGPGVYGTSWTTGVQGSGSTGVAGDGVNGVYGSGHSTLFSGLGTQTVGVRGYDPSASGFGFFAGMGVQGEAPSGYGVAGNGGVADFWAQNKGIKFPDGTMQTSAAQAVATGLKQCKGSNGSYIQSYTVPSSWTKAQCHAMLNTISAASSRWDVGCFSSAGPTGAGDWGAFNGGTPANNSCGW